MERLNLASVPGCAWTLALAFTDADTMRRRKIGAALRYGVYVGVLLLTAGTYHQSRRVVVSIYRRGTRAVLTTVLRALAVLVVLVVPVGVVLGAAASLTITMVTAVWLLLVGGWIAVEERRVRPRRDPAARREPNKPEKADWVMGNLAKRPGSGPDGAAAIAFAKACELSGNANETLGLAARNERLVAYYSGYGLRSLGEGSWRMIGTFEEIRAALAAKKS